MKNAVSKNHLRIAVYSSVFVGLLVGINFIIASRYRMGIIFMVTIPTIILICLINWSLLLGIDHLGRIRPNGILSSKKVLIPLYYMIGILSMLIFIRIESQIAEGRSIEMHFRTHYLYRRAFSGFVLCSVILAVRYTVTLIEEKQKVLLENERLMRENLQARFETLRQQVNPHFLFNSLSTLKTMMRIDVDKAEEYLVRLSEVFRYSLQTSNVEKVSLREELTILDAYIFMLKGRFDQNLTIDIQINKSLLDLFVPPFTLQIIVENCVKHNIISSEKPLLIKIYNYDADHITISNTLQPKKSVESASRVGLANIDKRYQYLCGQHIEIIESQDTFDVLIPLIVPQL